MTAAKKRARETGPRRSGPSGKHTSIEVKVRVPDETTKTRWQRAAARAGLTVNEWIRVLADGAAK